MLLRQGIHDETALVKDGRPNAVIVSPEGETAYLPLVEKIQKTVLAKTGVELSAFTDAQVLAAQSRFFVDPAFKKQNLILLGSVNTNRGLVELAANFYLYATSAWPGTNGYELRTVSNPFGTKSNCVVLGGSDEDGIERAVDEFLRVLQSGESTNTLVVPRLLKIVIDGKDHAESGPIELRRGTFAGTYRFAGACGAYNQTGSPARLRQIRDLIEQFLEEDRAPADEDYGTESAIRGLDLVDSFLMSPEENLKMDNALLRWVQDVVRDRPYWNRLGRSWSFGAHQSCGSLAFYAAANYLLKNGNPNGPARELLEEKRKESRAYLNYLSTSFKDRQKDVGWETWVALPALPRYALAEGDMTFFDSGTAANVVRRRFYAGQGLEPAALVSFVFNDGEFKSLEPDGGHLTGWAFVLAGAKWMPPPTLEPKRPGFLIGTKVMASSRTDWEHAHKGSAQKTSDWHTHLTWEKTFHLAGFVEGLEADDQFAVLGGWDSIGSMGEANSLRVFRQGGHDFLSRADGNSQRRPRPGRFYQNSLMVDSGDYSTAPPCASELVAHHDGPQMGMVSSRLSHFNGVDWHRNIFWHRGRYFAVLDLCTAQQDGPITLVNQWWSNDAPHLDEDTWSAHTGHGRFHLVMADAGSTSSRQWWDGGPQQLRQAKLVEARRGQQISFCNAFYLDSHGQRQSYEIRKAGPAAMMIRGRYEHRGQRVQEIALMGVGGARTRLRFGSLAVNARLFFVSPGVVGLEPAEGLSVQGRRLHVANGGLLSGSDRDLVREALEALWSTLPVGADSTGSAPTAQGSRYRLSSVSKRVPVAKTHFAAITGVAFSRLSDGTLTWDLGGDRRVMRIDGIRGDEQRVPVSCSLDNFQNDVRTVQGRTSVRHQWVTCQYGQAAKLGQGSVGPVNQVARHFRIGTPCDKLTYGLWIHKVWGGRSDANVTEDNPERFNRPFWQDVVFRSDEPRVEVLRTLAVDVDADGRQEVIVSTDNDELLVLNGDATVRWAHGFDSPILTFVCQDLEADGRREIVVASHDNHVNCFEHDGQRRFRFDAPESHKSRGPIFALSVYQTTPGRRGLMGTFYHGCLKTDHDGRFLKTQQAAPGFYEDTALPVAEDFNGDGEPDFVIRENVWGLVALIDGKSFEPVATHKTGFAGKGLAIVPWKLRDEARTNAVLVIARQGVAMLRVGPGIGRSAAGAAEGVLGGGIEPIFSLPVEPITGWDVADLNADGRKQIILSTQCGSVVVLDERGKTLAHALAGTEARDVAVVHDDNGTSQIIVTTGARMMLYDREMILLGAQDVKGPPCLKVQAFRDGKQPRVMAFFQDGTASVFSCKAGDAL